MAPNTDVIKNVAMAPWTVNAQGQFGSVVMLVNLNAAFLAQVAIADAWLPVIEWWANADFAIMQPVIPDGKSLAVLAITMMLGTAGQKEQKLQGESSGGDRVALMGNQEKTIDIGGET